MRSFVPPRLAVACLFALACRANGPSRPHTSLENGIEPLRAAFNADLGKVRVVLLVSPT